MKKFIIGVIIVLLGGCLGFGVYTYVQNHRYEHETELATSAVKKGNWSNASKHYQAAQSIKMTPKTETALTQLKHAKKAAQAAKNDNIHLAQSQYEAVMDVDDGLSVINKEAQVQLDSVNKTSHKKEKAQQQSRAQRRARSAAIEASKSESYALKDSLEISKSKSKSSEKRALKASRKKASVAKNSNKKNEKKDTAMTH